MLPELSGCFLQRGARLVFLLLAADLIVGESKDAMGGYALLGGELNGMNMCSLCGRNSEGYLLVEPNGWGPTTDSCQRQRLPVGRQT